MWKEFWWCKNRKDQKRFDELKLSQKQTLEINIRKDLHRRERKNNLSTPKIKETEKIFLN